MIATLAEVLQPALAGGCALPGLVVLGWEDAVAFTRAGAAEGRAIILQAGPGCRRHTPLPVLGAMFRHLAFSAPSRRGRADHHPFANLRPAEGQDHHPGTRLSPL